MLPGQNVEPNHRRFFCVDPLLPSVCKPKVTDGSLMRFVLNIWKPLNLMTAKFRLVVLLKLEHGRGCNSSSWNRQRELVTNCSCYSSDTHPVVEIPQQFCQCAQNQSIQQGSWTIVEVALSSWLGRVKNSRPCPFFLPIEASNHQFHFPCLGPLMA